MKFTLKAVKPFRDKMNSGATIKSGSELVIEDLNRVNSLVALGLCVITGVADVQAAPADNNAEDQVEVNGEKFNLSEVKAALETIGATVAKNAAVPGVTKAIENLTEEQTEALNVELTKE